MERMAEYLTRAHEGDKEARDTLVHKNIGLVWSIVRRFTGRGYDAEELFQVGTIGLLKAIDHFDFSYEVKFSTYAVPLIAGEIRRFLRDDGMLKVSRSLKENAGKVSRAARIWREQKNAEPTLSELSDATGLSTEDIVLAVSAGAGVDSIDREVAYSDGKPLTIREQLADERDEIGLEMNRIFLEQLLGGLDNEERRLIGLRYFQGKTQTEVAGMLHITQVQVSRREKKLLAKLRQLAG